MSIPAFVKIHALGKREISNIFVGEVEVTEKVDGSQFSIGVSKHGDIVCRSKKTAIYPEAPPSMFKAAMAYIDTHRKRILDILPPQTFIHGEYLRQPKHNVIAYGRVPRNHIIVFGVREGLNLVTSYEGIARYAEALDLEVVPLLFQGELSMKRIEKSDGSYSYEGYDFLKRLIETTYSALSEPGKALIEGVVVKNYNQLTTLGESHICCGKYVRETFKERHSKKQYGGRVGLDGFIQSFKTEARWQKAVQWLAESGELEHSPRDIGKIIKRIHEDIMEEEESTIRDFLCAMFIGQIKRTAAGGVAEWYKEELLKGVFENAEDV